MNAWHPRTTSAVELGAHRVLEPAGALPQAATKLDAGSPPGPTEMGVHVQLLNLDSTSHRQIREECGGNREAMAEQIRTIVEEAGKMHNPVTDSGGILVGQIASVGAAFPGNNARPGDRIATLASLTTTPLRLTEVGPLDLDSAQFPAKGYAIVAASAPWTKFPEDIPFRLAVACLDVYGAAPKVRALAQPGGRVLVLGTGRAGLMCLAAARDAVGAGGTVTAVDYSARALELARSTGLCDLTVEADATDPLGTLDALSHAGVQPADVTVSVVNVPRAETAAVLATRPYGDVLFFSMSTSFTRATLGAEAFGATARMIFGSGYDEDRGEYTLSLVRSNARLYDALCQLEQVEASNPAKGSRRRR